MKDTGSGRPLPQDTAHPSLEMLAAAAASGDHSAQELIDLLLRFVHARVGRALLIAVSRGHLRVSAARGFGEPLTDEHTAPIALRVDGYLEAVSGGKTYYQGPVEVCELAAVYEALTRELPIEVAVVPVRVGERTPLLIALDADARPVPERTLREVFRAVRAVGVALATLAAPQAQGALVRRRRTSAPLAAAPTSPTSPTGVRRRRGEPSAARVTPRTRQTSVNDPALSSDAARTTASQPAVDAVAQDPRKTASQTALTAARPETIRGPFTQPLTRGAASRALSDDALPQLDGSLLEAIDPAGVSAPSAHHAPLALDPSRRAGPTQASPTADRARHPASRHAEVGEPPRPASDPHRRPPSDEHTAPPTGIYRRPGSGEHRHPGSDEHRRLSTAEHRRPDTGAYSAPGSGEHRRPISGEHRQPISGEHRQPISGEHRRLEVGEARRPGSDEHRRLAQAEPPAPVVGTYESVSGATPRLRPRRGAYAALDSLPDLSDAIEPLDFYDDVLAPEAAQMVQLEGSVIVGVDHDYWVKRLDDPDPSVEQRARALLSRPEPEALEALLRGFPGRLRIDRFQPCDVMPPAAEHSALLECLLAHGEAVAPRLVPLLEAAGADERFYALLLFESLHHEAVLPHLEPQLFHKDPQVRALALRVLKQWQYHPISSTICAALRERLRQSDERQALVAAMALGELRDMECVEGLIELLGDGQARVIEVAHRALVCVALTDEGRHPRRWTRWLQRLESRDRRLLIAEAMVHKERQIRQLAAEDLQGFPGLLINYHPDASRRDRVRARHELLEWLQRHPGRAANSIAPWASGVAHLSSAVRGSTTSDLRDSSNLSKRRRLGDSSEPRFIVRRDASDSSS